MKVKVLFFGIVRDIVGENSIELELIEDSSVNIFHQVLRKRYSGLTDIENFAVAVNEEYADRDYLIHENDVIAIIPPVSGG